ncbi:MAG: metalloprotease [Candidatus Diapherotrites archaeon]|jgi:proteasome lid subunit RPN8/RPN11|uniref:Metalloprotease n=1 Tax=Candidatus Iainarchaeum sp. TaxID=3101447 RepID=A0A7K4BYV4_9ARCH|nr:metalloprotease [Candidatus Diapherotrites archaeon]
MWKIKKELLEEIIRAAQKTCPYEFLCLLSGKNETIEEIVFIPNINGKNFVEINTHNIPIDNTIIGTIHSHPHGENTPSKADKKFFQNYQINGIINYTYQINQVRFYNKKGETIEIEII